MKLTVRTYHTSAFRGTAQNGKTSQDNAKRRNRGTETMRRAELLGCNACQWRKESSAAQTYVDLFRGLEQKKNKQFRMAG